MIIYDMSCFAMYSTIYESITFISFLFWFQFMRRRWCSCWWKTERFTQMLPGRWTWWTSLVSHEPVLSKLVLRLANSKSLYFNFYFFWRIQINCIYYSVVNRNSIMWTLSRYIEWMIERWSDNGVLLVMNDRRWGAQLPLLPQKQHERNQSIEIKMMNWMELLMM